MAAKRIGISHDLIIHPGETISDVLIERGIRLADGMDMVLKIEFVPKKTFR